MSNRLVQLDAMRGIAVLMVVGYHYTTTYQQTYSHAGPLPFSVSAGLFGVHLFFMISGFVIFMTLERTEDYKDFLVSRFARLYPMYWASVIIGYICLQLFPLPGKVTTLSVALVNLSMLQQWFRKAPDLNDSYWTLYVELSFYAIMLGIFTLRRLNRIMLIATLWLCAMLLSWALEHFAGLSLLPIIKRSFLFDDANLFFAGIMFYKLYRSEDTRRATLILIACLAVEFIIHSLKSGMIISCFFIMFYTVATKTRLINLLLATRPLVYIGTISYSLYLLHENIGYILLRALYAIDLSPAIAISITVAVSITLAACTTLLVESPARQAIRSYWTKKRPSLNSSTLLPKPEA